MSISSDITRIKGAKADLKTAINAKGGTITNELIDEYAAAVDALSGSSVLTGDAAVGEVLSGKTFYSNDPDTKLTGTMPNNGEVDTDITAVAQSVTIAQGYHNGSGTVQISAADQAKLIADNIKSGVTVLGVAGNVTSGTDTSDATATAADILGAKTAYGSAGTKLTGTATDAIVVKTRDASQYVLTCDFYGTTVPNRQFSGGHTSHPSGFYYMTDVTFKDTVTSFGNYAFYDAQAYVPTSLPSTLTSIGEYCFANGAGSAASKIAVTALPGGLLTIGRNAFQSCSLLNISALPSTLTSIGQEAFYGASKITVSSIPAGVTTIGTGTFRQCNAITSMTFHAGITNIPDLVFRVDSGTPAMTSFTGLGIATVSGTSSANSPFYNQTALTTVQLGSIGHAVTSLTANSFYGCAQAGLTITIYVVPGTQPLANSPWGATNATIVYRSSVDGSIL